MHTDVLKDQLVIAYVASLVLEWLKRSSLFPWINANTDTLNRTLSKMLAIATSAGISWAWVGTPDAGWTLTVSIPAIHGLIDFAGNAVISFFAQEVAYRSSIKKKENPA